MIQLVAKNQTYNVIIKQSLFIDINRNECNILKADKNE